MKKVININFQGRVVPIEETSYDLLKQYTDSLRIYFANEEGRDEIINDIESRIGELFQERIKNGATCITDDDINGIINNIGRPQDLADADSVSGSGSYTKSEQSEGAYQQTAFITGKRLYRDANNKILGGVCSGIAAYFNIEPIIVRLVFIFSGIGFLAYILLWAFVPSSNSVQNGVRKRLYRNPDNKIIAGVCSGIASYFNINVWIPRILFLIPFISIFFRWVHFGPLNFPNFIGFSFSPGTLLIYIILWLVIPEASTTSEKLEMKGERVDLNSIKNSVKEEMKGVKERIAVAGKEGAEFGKKVGEEFTYVAKRTRTSLGDIIVVLVKIFLYFLLAIFAVMSFGFAIAATGIFPFKDYLLNAGWQNVLAWGTLLFMIYVPVIGIITWIIRRIAKIRSNSRMMRWGFFILWVVGVICFISLIVSLSRDFRSLNNLNEEKIALVNPKDSLLEVGYNTGRFNRFRMEPFGSIIEDTAFVENVSVRVIKSDTDSFQVTVTKFVNGRTRHDADTLAALMNYNVVQKDSSLSLLIDRGIPITEQDKFRNQRVVVTIAVPVGKRIRINNRVSSDNWERFQFPWTEDGNYYDWETESFPWYNHKDEELIMKEDGLYTLDGKKTSEDWGQRRSTYRRVGPNKVRVTVEDGDSSNPGYRYEKTIDSLQLIKEKEIKRMKDSLRKQKEELDKKLEKLDQSADAFGRKYDFIMGI